MTYRPRGTLARTLYDKIHNDQYLEGYDMRLVSLKSIHHKIKSIFIYQFLYRIISVVLIAKTIAGKISK